MNDDLTLGLQEHQRGRLADAWIACAQEIIDAVG